MVCPQMPTNSDKLEEGVDRLYALPLPQFTAARDELARGLRGEGDRGRAEAIKRLHRPTVAAWALNQVWRVDPRGIEELIAAGQRLRDAQERLLAGDREPLARATAEERQLVKELARHAERQLVAAGLTVSAAVQSRLWATLRAVASDPEARELISAGRLVHDYEVSDLGLALATTDGLPGGQARLEQPRRTEATVAVDAGVAREIRAVRQRLARSRARQQKSEQKREDAQRDAEDARREAARAAATLKRAEAVAEQAGAIARESTSRVTALEATLKELESCSAKPRSR